MLNRVDRHRVPTMTGMSAPEQPPRHLSRHHHAPTRPAHEPALARTLRSRGLRMTAQREQVLAAVRALQHATPEQIAEQLPEVDPATVYRSLELLEDLGLVKHTHLGHGAPSYRPAEDDHIHIVCHHCGTVIQAPAGLVDSLEARLRDERGFTLDRSHLTVFGACATCQDDNEDNEDNKDNKDNENNDNEESGPA
jgi:Fur family ferric uptake transcriptional regulator